MKTLFNKFLIIFTLLTLNLSCVSNPKLYKPDSKERVLIGKLSELQFNSLNKILETNTSSSLQDTLFIKYDYNNESCWNNLDQQSKKYILQVISDRKQRKQKILKDRPNISIFNFRESGDNFNKIKDWDNEIIIDKDNKLFNLIFTQRYRCGNSIIIMPDKQFIFIRSDPHFEALEVNKKRIEEILNSTNL